MRRLIEADLEAEGLKEVPEDVVRRRREQAVSNGKSVEKLDRLRADVGMLSFEGVQLSELPDPVLL